LLLETRLLITDRTRGGPDPQRDRESGRGARLDGVADGSLPDPPLDTLAALAAGAPAGPLWLTGGEPTLRPDLPRVIAAVRAAREDDAPLGLVTDGLALAHPGRLKALRGAGIDRLRVLVHSLRPDAHDWLVGLNGAWRTAVRTLELCRDAGLTTEIEATITRPTAPYLAELVALAERVGAGAVHLRALRPRGRAAAEEIALTPRYALLEPALVEARHLGADRDVAVHVHGVPRCAAGSAGHAVVPGSRLRWLAADGDGWAARLHALGPAPSAGGCGRCPGAEGCDGAPARYVARFGWTELLSEGAASDGLTDPREERSPETGLPVPEPRAGRVPFTRTRVVKLPPASPGRSPAPPEAVWLDLVDDAGAFLTRRAARLRLVNAAQHGARTLRIVGRGAFDHPDAASLLRDATRLSVERVEVAGDGAALATMPVRELYLLRRLSRGDVALYGPDAASHDARAGREGAFEATLSGLQRLARLAQIPVGAYGVLRDDDDLAAWARAWDAGDLPGTPRFRLAAEGGDLDRLATAAAALPEGRTRTALLDVLPPCRFAPDAPAPPERPPHGARQTHRLERDAAPGPLDPLGDAAPCPRLAPGASGVCGDDGVRYARPCPGVPARWALAPRPDAPRARPAAPTADARSGDVTA